MATKGEAKAPPKISDAESETRIRNFVRSSVTTPGVNSTQIQLAAAPLLSLGGHAKTIAMRAVAVAMEGRDPFESNILPDGYKNVQEMAQVKQIVATFLQAVNNAKY